MVSSGALSWWPATLFTRRHEGRWGLSDKMVISHHEQWKENSKVERGAHASLASSFDQSLEQKSPCILCATRESEKSQCLQKLILQHCFFRPS